MFGFSPNLLRGAIGIDPPQQISALEDVDNGCCGGVVSGDPLTETLGVVVSPARERRGQQRKGVGRKGARKLESSTNQELRAPRQGKTM